MSDTFTEREQAAWRPPEDLSVSEWAERYRVLPTRQSASPGHWMNRAYYTVDVMDSFAADHVERITVMASVQSSKTESTRNMLGYAICQDPAPALVVMPTLTTLRRVNDHIRLMVQSSPALARHLTGDPEDLTKQEITLDNMALHFATAGSSVDLRNVEARYVFLDEVDDYPRATSDQGSPIEMAEARATTFWNRKIVTCCTPTTEDGFVNIEYQRSDRRKYWVPCPHCGGYQALSFWRVKCAGSELGNWPKEKRIPEYIKTNRIARYACEHCNREIDDTDKFWMLLRGTWVPDGHPIERDGTVAIPLPRATHVGYWWSALYSPWRTFSDVAAQFFASKNDPEKYKVFVNLYLAEPWKEVAIKREDTEIMALRTERPSLIVPPATVVLTAGIDHQKAGFWVVIRAWQRDLESHLVRHGFVEDWSELEKWLFEDLYPLEDTDIMMPVWRAGIDIGGTEMEPGEATQTEEVYQWLRRSGRGVVFGVKGSSRSLGGGRKMKPSVIDKMPGKSGRPIPGGIKLWLLDVGLIKDAIWSRIESGKFHLHADVDIAYTKHLTAETKERDAKKGYFVWKPQGHRANHLFDAEVYAAAMADPECDGGVRVARGPFPRKGTTFPQSDTEPRRLIHGDESQQPLYKRNSHGVHIGDSGQLNGRIRNPNFRGY